MIKSRKYTIEYSYGWFGIRKWKIIETTITREWIDETYGNGGGDWVDIITKKVVQTVSLSYEEAVSECEYWKINTIEDTKSD